MRQQDPTSNMQAISFFLGTPKFQLKPVAHPPVILPIPGMNIQALNLRLPPEVIAYYHQNDIHPT